jgi:hypothetical protein
MPKTKERELKPVRRAGKSKPPAPAPAGAVMLTRGQVAFRLAVSIKTLSAWAADRVGPPFVKFGDARNAVVRYPLDEFDAWVDSRRKASKEATR